MLKFLTPLLMLLLSSPLLAVVREEPSQAPVETVGTVYIVIFAVVFIGMIVGFLAYLFMTDKKAKPEDK